VAVSLMDRRWRGASRIAAVAIVLMCGVAGARPTAAQNVLISPQAIVVDPRTRTGEVTLVNEGTAPAEVAVSALYGYPVTDSAGTMRLQTFTSVDDSAPSMASWIDVFPRRLKLAPRARQTLRILVSPPDSLAQREYWARLVVAVRGGKIAVANTSTTPNISAGLNLEVRSVLGVFYRNGAVTTGVTMHDVLMRRTNDSVIARVRLDRKGNAAFVGALSAVLRDSLGNAVSRGLIPLGVYYTLSPRISVPAAGLRRGRYTLTLEAATARPDVAAPLLVHAPSVSQTLDVVVP